MDNNNNNFNPQQPNNNSFNPNSSGTFNNPNVTPQNYQQDYNQNYSYNQNQNYQQGYNQNPNQNYQQGYNQQPYYGGPEDPGKGLGIASLICGIAGLVLTWFYGIGFIPSVAGLILAIISGNKSQSAGFKRNGMALGGLICSIVSLALSLIVFACVVCVCTAALSSPSSYYYY